MYEDWVNIPEFPDYAVSYFGNIRNDRFGREVAISYNREGVAKVGLMSGGVQRTRSVKVLVAEAFIPIPNPRFDTPINLDGNLANNMVPNLAWRPRWFAWKYRKQMASAHKYIDSGPVRNTRTGILYPNIVEAGIANGLLFSELLTSIVNQVPVIPTWHHFEWA